VYLCALRVHAEVPARLSQRCISYMSRRNAGAVALVILLGLVLGSLGVVEDDLYTVGVLILVIGSVGAAVLGGEYLIRYLTSRQPPA
jgi:TRAP-type mannitol/chloroaromatic compound transport system permease large subunit